MTNKTITLISLATTAILTGSAALALAEPGETPARHIPAIDNAIEIAVSTGYAGGMGDIDSASQIDDVAGAGAHVELQAGYRIDPRFALAAYGSITDHSDGDKLSGTNNDVFTATTGLMATWHFSPTTDTDPWLSFGAGVRYMKVDAQSATDQRDLFGIDAARVQAGIDFRVTPTFAIGPVLGASLTKFVWDKRMDDEWNEIEDRDLNVHFNAGLMGRFDGPLGKSSR
jgi:hypothetical protein